MQRSGRQTKPQEYTPQDIAKILRQKSDKKSLKDERRSKYYHYVTKKDKATMYSFQEYTPKGEEAQRKKYHYDFVRDEANWMSIDFYESRKWERAMHYKLSHEAAIKS